MLGWNIPMNKKNDTGVVPLAYFDSAEVEKAKESVSQETIVEKLKELVAEISSCNGNGEKHINGNMWRNSVVVKPIDADRWEITWNLEDGCKERAITDNEAANSLKKIIETFPLNPERITLKDLFTKIIEMNNLQSITADTFKTTKENREKFYFPLFLRPILILEYLNIVEYNRSVSRLK